MIIVSEAIFMVWWKSIVGMLKGNLVKRNQRISVASRLRRA